jgi:phenylacetate-CoA ligase
LNFNSKEKLEDFQLKQLKKLLTYAYQNVPYYQKLFDKIHFIPKDFQSIEDFKKIPYLTKNIIRENKNELISTKIPKKYIKKVRTGGTTGMPTEFILDKRYATLTEMVYLKHMWSDRLGYKIRSRCILLREDTVETIVEGKKYWKRNTLTNWLVMSAFHLNADTFKIYYNKIKSFKPEFILAFPSNALLLARFMKDNNLAPISSIKGIICASENLYDWQREFLTEVFDAKIFSYYGHSEKCVIAPESDETGNFEFYPQYGFAELLNSNGEDCKKENERGEIIATGFNNYISPFIRYKTDDVGTYTSQRSSNHPFWFNIKKIDGRVQDFLIDRDHVPKTYMHIDRPFWNLRDKVYAYQYVQNEPGKIILNIHSKNEIEEEEILEIKKIFHSTYFKFDLEVQKVNHIARSKSGKFRYLVQNVKTSKRVASQ